MATISFYQNVVVTDKDKIEEIKQAMKSDDKAYKNVPPAKIDFEAQKENAEKWCSLLKK